MRLRSTVASVAALVVLATALAACAPEDDRTLPGSSLTVATTAAITSLNPLVLGQDTAADADAAALTAAGFWSIDTDGRRTPHEEFGTVRVLSQDPLTVRYTVADGATWSDGAAVDAADLLLSWASRTTHRSSPEPDGATRWQTGAGTGQALDLVSAVPEIVDGGRGITLVYDTPYADWQAAFDAPPVAAHALVALAYPGEYADAAAAKTAFRDAVQEGDLDWLAPVSRAFREDFRLDGDLPPEALISAGAYRVERASEDGAVVDYVAVAGQRGAPSPRAERVRVVAVPDAGERIAAVVEGRADLTAAIADSALVAQASDAAASVVSMGEAFDHVDLQTAGGGVFDPATYGGDPALAQSVRAAFLATVPRASLLDELVRPVAPEAALPAGVLRSAAASASEATPAAGDDQDGEAAALLAEAGLASATVRVLYPAGDARRLAEFTALAAAAAPVGITLVDVSSDDWARVLVDEPTAYDAALFAWSPDPGAPLAAATAFHTAAAQNVYGWSDETVDTLIVEASATLDAEARRGLLADLDEALAARSWTLPLFDLPRVTVASAALGEPPAVDPQRLLRTFATWDPAAAASPSTR